MTLAGFALVVAAAFCHATWNFYVKRINAGPELVWLFSAVTVVIYAPLAIYVLATQDNQFNGQQLLFIFGSMVLHLAYFLLLQKAYSKGDLSVIYPTARATGPLLSTTFAVLILGEKVNAQIVLGGLAIIVGVLCLTGGFRSGGRNILTSIAFGVATGMLIATYTIWDAYAVATLLVAPLLLDYASSVGRCLILLPIAHRKRDAITRLCREHWFGVLVIAALNPLAYILVLYALTFTPVVYVAPTRELSVMITVLMGSLLLGEGHTVRRLLWAAVITSGVALLATA
ncbi:MAG: EamA family transporter [Hyphomicrobiaceae bacterium]|nr:EamA family transporter [Hyphomicrobiaceae bacterium]